MPDIYFKKIFTDMVTLFRLHSYWKVTKNSSPMSGQIYAEKNKQSGKKCSFLFPDMGYGF